MEQPENIITTVAEKKVYTVTVPVRHIPSRSLLDRLLKRPIPATDTATERTFTIRPCVVGTSVRIAERVALLPKQILSGTLSESMLPLLNKCIPDMAYIIATAIQNDCREPKKELIAFIQQNFTLDQIFEALLETIEAMQLQAFLDCIILMKGTVRILKPSEDSE